MKGGTVQINWHDCKPVLTLDFHPISGLLATGGADFDIKLWLVSPSQAEKKLPSVSYQNSLTYHGCAVNTLRFSRSGELLASGADGGELIIWKLHTTETNQTWKVFKSLTFHRKDVLDLQWSTDDAFLISGSVDNSCIIWDVNKGSVHQILDAHCHYVQGVAWDPLSKYIASLSSDRTCRIYVNKRQTKSKGGEKVNYVCQHVITKADQQLGDDSKTTKTHLFHDETLPSFFRRLSWSPDGSFLLVPAGSYKLPPASESVNTTYVFSRKDLSRPALQLPGASKPVIAVRFCPVAFKLRDSKSAGFFKLPYRLIFAVASLNSVYVYDTESVAPIAILAGLHYAAITDITWSPSASYLALSSQDGYCTLVQFEENELGEPASLSDGKNPEKGEERSPVIQKPDELMTEARADEVSREAGPERKKEKQFSPRPTITSISVVDGKEPDKIEERSPVIWKTDDMMTEARAEDGGRQADPGRKEEKQPSPRPETTRVSNKPAKKRITPVAVDP